MRQTLEFIINIGAFLAFLLMVNSFCLGVFTLATFYAERSPALVDTFEIWFGIISGIGILFGLTFILAIIINGVTNNEK